MTITEIRNILESPYDRKVWKTFIQTQFTNNKLYGNEQVLSLGDKTLSKQCLTLGNYEVDEYTKIGIFEVELNEKVNITRNRVALRNLIKDITKQVSGAMVVFVQGDKWRFSYISKRKIKNKDTNEIQDKETAPKRYTYLFGKNEKALTASIRFDRLIQKQRENIFQFLTLNDFEDAFSVEKLSKEFFKNYKDTYEDFVQFLTGKRYGKKGNKYVEQVIHEPNWQLTSLFNKDEKQARDFCKRIMGRIVFLYFIQKKGWLAVTQNKNWGEGNPDYMFDLFNKSKHQTDFYHEELVPLFFKTLNNPDSEKINNAFRYPYLNGGLFDDSHDKNYNKLQLPENVFRTLFETFNNFNFTVYEDAPDEHTVAVDPEMLGHIFENLLEDNKDKGAFYTPKEIVHYMCKESLNAYLLAHDELQCAENDLAKKTIEHIIQQQELSNDEKQYAQKNAYKIIDALEQVKICDPAIGSGAFPMGLLQEIFNAQIYLQELKGFKKGITDAQIKKHIIEESIYGVDIDAGAVDIARLRFWLSLVVDEQVPQPLPNLDFKIVCANTLIPLGELKGDFGNTHLIVSELEQVRHEYFSASSAEKKDLERMFLNLQKKLINTAKEWVTKDDADIYLKLLEFSPFEDTSCSWFDTWWMFGIKDGFDIVIGNPPYIKESTNKKAFNGFKKTKYYQGKMDLWYGFACVMLDNLKKDTGILTFIATNNWVTNAGASKFRNKIVSDAKIKKIIDFTNYKIFESADIQTMIMFFQNDKENIEFSFDYRKVTDTQVTIDDVIDILEKKESQKFQYLEPIFNRDYFKDKTFVFSNDNDSAILNTILQKGTFFIDGGKELMSGIDVLQDAVNKNSQITLGANFKVGDGIFVLSNTEKENLNFSEKELELIKPFYTAKELTKIYGEKDNNYWIIYTNSSFKDPRKILGYPKIKEHLDKFRAVITSENGTYGLNRPREEYFFQGEKIMSVRKCAIPAFTYTDFDCYVSRAFFSIKSNRINHKYLTAVLNSKLVAFWLKHKGKMQGFQYQVDKDPIINIPIAISEDTEIFHSLVDYIIFLKANVGIKTNEYVSNEHVIQSFEDVINACVYELYFPEHMKEKEINVISFAKEFIKPISQTEKVIEKTEIINSVYSKLKEPSNEIRNRMMLFATRSENILLPIQKIY